MTGLRVSVVVPIFNPGPGFDKLIQSLDRQTLASQAFEVILCDDGSGESTRERLEQVARARTNVRVLTLAHTGWPGTPRNHGIDAAQGTYVFFSDQDDFLFERALQQLCDYADRHASDVVIGKVVGIGRRIPGRIFRRDVPRAVLGHDPLLELLTPHKLFRLSFLRENDIRFPDGRVRLEDHLFVMHAYFQARTISILATQPCYGWVKNAGSASSSRIDPVTYFPHLEAVLDLVEANTDPGRLRDTLVRHWYRGKILKRLEGRRLVRYPDDYRERFLDVVTPIAQARFGPGVEHGLPFPHRVRSALLRAGRRTDLLHLAEFETGLSCHADVTSARWTRGGKLQLTLQVRVLRDGKDAFIDSRNSPASEEAPAPTAQAREAVCQLPEFFGSDFLPSTVPDATRDLRKNRVDISLRVEADKAMSVASERRIAGRVQRNLARVTVTIDPLEVFGRSDSSTGGRLMAHVRYAGWTFDTALRARKPTVDAIRPSPVLAGRKCVLVAGTNGSVALRRDWPAGRVRDLVARAVRRGRRLVRNAGSGVARVLASSTHASRATTSKRRSR